MSLELAFIKDLLIKGCFIQNSFSMRHTFSLFFLLFFINSSAQDSLVLDTTIQNHLFNKFYEEDTLAMRSKVMEPTDDGGFLIGGIYANLIEGGKALYVRKIDSLGQTVFVETLDDGDFDELLFPGWLFSGRQMTKSNDGHYVITYSYGRDGFKWGTKVIKFTKDADILWEKYYEYMPPVGVLTPYKHPRMIVQTNDGGYFITGTESSSVQFSKYAVLKLNALGEKEWDKVFDETYNARALSGRQTNDGGFIVSGFAETETYWDMYIIKMDSLGNNEWDLVLGTENSDCGAFLEVLSTNEFLIHGCVYLEEFEYIPIPTYAFQRNPFAIHNNSCHYVIG